MSENKKERATPVYCHIGAGKKVGTYRECWSRDKVGYWGVVPIPNAIYASASGKVKYRVKNGVVTRVSQAKKKPSKKKLKATAV